MRDRQLQRTALILLAFAITYRKKHKETKFLLKVFQLSRMNPVSLSQELINSC